MVTLVKTNTRLSNGLIIFLDFSLSRINHKINACLNRPKKMRCLSHLSLLTPRFHSCVILEKMITEITFSEQNVNTNSRSKNIWKALCYLCNSDDQSSLNAFLCSSNIWSTVSIYSLKTKVLLPKLSIEQDIWCRFASTRLPKSWIFNKTSMRLCLVPSFYIQYYMVFHTYSGSCQILCRRTPKTTSTNNQDWSITQF